MELSASLKQESFVECGKSLIFTSFIAVIDLWNHAQIKMSAKSSEMPKGKHLSVVVVLGIPCCFCSAALVNVNVIIFSKDEKLQKHFAIFRVILKEWGVNNSPWSHIAVLDIIVDFNALDSLIPLLPILNIEDSSNELLLLRESIFEPVGRHLDGLGLGKTESRLFCDNIYSR